jgi:hypothetical protein
VHTHPWIGAKAKQISRSYHCFLLVHLDAVCGDGGTSIADGAGFVFWMVPTLTGGTASLRFCGGDGRTVQPIKLMILLQFASQTGTNSIANKCRT